jgi:nucleotide-binding universal stress UspA family protein
MPSIEILERRPAGDADSCRDSDSLGARSRGTQAAALEILGVNPVIEFKNLLCPIDFSDTSVGALVCATAMARSYEAQLTVLHVVPAFGVSPDGGRSIEESGLGVGSHSRDDVLTVLRGAVDSIEQVRTAGLRPALVAEEGRVHETIVKCAAALPADLLVMGTHGRSGFDRLLFGSVTEKVLRTAPCPVLTVPPSARALPAAPITFQRIVCPVDFSPSALKALEYALEFGRRAGGCVTVLHAVEYMDEEEPCEHVDARVRESRQHIVERARHRLRDWLAMNLRKGHDVAEVVVASRAYRAILRHAAQSASDIIVMGAQGHAGIDLMLYGSNAQHVARAATCPVLTVRA